MNNYIYLIQTREFRNTNKNIYKLGKTKQDNLTRTRVGSSSCSPTNMRRTKTWSWMNS